MSIEHKIRRIQRRVGWSDSILLVILLSIIRRLSPLVQEEILHDVEFDANLERKSYADDYPSKP